MLLCAVASDSSLVYQRLCDGFLTPDPPVDIQDQGRRQHRKRRLQTWEKHTDDTARLWFLTLQMWGLGSTYSSNALLNSYYLSKMRERLITLVISGSMLLLSVIQSITQTQHHWAALYLKCLKWHIPRKSKQRKLKNTLAFVFCLSSVSKDSSCIIKTHPHVVPNPTSVLFETQIKIFLKKSERFLSSSESPCNQNFDTLTSEKCNPYK